jgi:hypothetical protein
MNEVDVMTHEDAGHYKRKHPSDREPKPEILAAVKRKASKGEISCAAAHKIAEDTKTPPLEVGFAVDFLEIRLTRCQLGLYGYRPQKRVVKPAAAVSDALQDAIQNSLVDGRLSCEAAWKIARKQGLRKMDVSSACEALRIKISSCQLGAF